MSQVTKLVPEPPETAEPAESVTAPAPKIVPLRRDYLRQLQDHLHSVQRLDNEESALHYGLVATGHERTDAMRDLAFWVRKLLTGTDSALFDVATTADKIAALRQFAPSLSDNDIAVIRMALDAGE